MPWPAGGPGALRSCSFRVQGLGFKVFRVGTGVQECAGRAYTCSCEEETLAEGSGAASGLVTGT